MKTLTALVFIVLGVVAIVLGHRRSESVAGVADEVGATLANKWDGKARQPDHVWYYAGGGVLILAGGAMLLRKRSA